MRILIVVVLAIVALGAAGVWALGQFGDSLTGAKQATTATVREAQPVAVADATPKPAEPPATKPSATPATKSKEKTAPAVAATPEPIPAPTADPARPQPAPAPPPAPESSTGSKPNNPFLAQSLDDSRAAKSAPAAPAPAPAEVQVQAAPAAPPPPPPPSTQLATTQSAPAASPAPASLPTTTAQPVSLDQQIKSRRLTYNRPPKTLALNKPIDISLVIDSTGQNQAAEEMKNLPGTVVERDVGLSDFVSAELSGADFDIQLQTAASRQKLSPKIANEWRWRVTPTATGPHTLTLTVYGYESGSLDAEPLDSYRDDISVEVQQLDQIINWAKGVQPVFAILAALAGATSALFAMLRFREERKRNKPAA
ncbi:MAG TPA: hypothetical protein VG942_11375 [Hyphomonadaceae bacterium]|nr:hypothetical protein [Hyphomonadaceae bacterium]